MLLVPKEGLQPEQLLTLLQQAAKAIRCPVDFDCEVNGYYAKGYDDSGAVTEWWNPALSDSDTMDLIVKLKLTLAVEQTVVCCINEDSSFTFRCRGNDAAAARLAVVLTAADVGRRLLKKEKRK